MIDRSEIGAAWIVAIALIAATGGQALLPEMPPRLGHGVVNLMPRPDLDLPDPVNTASDTDLQFEDRHQVLAAEIPPGASARSRKC